MKSEIEAVSKALGQPNGTDAERDLTAVLNRNRGEIARLALQLYVLERIDALFAPVHPRSLDSSVSHLLPDWLQAARDQRRLDGAYATLGSLRLIARGPLLRANRKEFDSYSATLEDRFAYLAVAPATVRLSSGTQIDLNFLPVIDEDPWNGVSPSSTGSGTERLCAVPVAEVRTHLDLSPVMRGGRRYLAYGPAAGFDAVNAFLSAVQAAGDVDIAIAPEFVMATGSHEAISSILRADPSKARMLIAGTANTKDQKHDQPYNEAFVSNRWGNELWRQRKVTPSLIQPERAVQFGVSADTGAGPFHEDTASGSCINVVDIDSIGRCLILICQDFESDSTAQLARCIQADWIFVPVLDRGFAVKSWFVDRARALSNVSQARLVGVCSTALPRTDHQAVYCMTIVWAAHGETGKGPFNAIAFCPAAGNPGYAVHHFGVDATETIVNQTVPSSAVIKAPVSPVCPPTA